MSASASPTTAPAFAVMRRRRSFGLDAARLPDLDRTESAILAWLAAKTPQVFWLKAATPVAKAGARKGSTLLLLLSGGRIAVLRIEVQAGRVAPDTLALARQCRERHVPLSIVSDVDEVKAALRRLGIEAEEA